MLELVAPTTARRDALLAAHDEWGPGLHEDGFGIALRAQGDPRVGALGHLGYGIRPSARGRGVAGWALAEVLTHARSQEVTEVVAVCRADNIASIRTVEKCGGRQFATAERGGSRAHHYLFELG